MKKYSYVFFLIFINILLLSTLDTLKLEYLGETTTKGIYVFDFISNDEILFYEMFDKFYTLNPKGEKKAYIDDKIEGITFIDIGENEILYSRFEHYLIGELYIIDKDTLKQKKIEKFSKNCPKKAFWIDQSNIIFQKPMRYYDESEQFEIRKLNLITNEEETILNNYSLIEYYNYNLLLRNQEEDSVNKHKYFLYNTKNDFLLLLNIEDNLTINKFDFYDDNTILFLKDSRLHSISKDKNKPVVLDIESNSGIDYFEYNIEYKKLVILKRIQGSNYKIRFYQVLDNSFSLTPAINNLRFREAPKLSGKFIRFLKSGEKLELIEKGKVETIGRETGTWVKVKTEQGEIGWCFDAYLEEVKKK